MEDVDLNTQEGQREYIRRYGNGAAIALAASLVRQVAANVKSACLDDAEYLLRTWKG